MNAPSSIKVFQKPILFFLRIYSNYISYFFPASCRFYPSCSHYAQDAVATHGVVRGLYLSTRRLLRCHPWHEGGYDPVPKIKIPLQKQSAHNHGCAAHAHQQTLGLIEDKL